MLLQALLKVAGMQDLIEGLASYTQRHFARMDRLVRSSFLLEYTLASMNVLMPEEGPDVLAADDLDQPEAVGSDLDESTGTEVDTDAFMQPAADIQADEHTQAVLTDQQQLEPLESVPMDQQASGLQECPAEPEGDHEAVVQQTKKQTSKKRRKSAPLVSLSSRPAVHAGSQTAVKAKRKKVK